MVPEWTWDLEKARANLRKHGVSFAEAVIALEDPLALTVPDRKREEERLATVGQESEGRLIVVPGSRGAGWPDPLCAKGDAPRAA